jgi:hypothetical protein
MLGATQKQLFQGTPTEGGGFDITGFQPYRAYGGKYDAAGNQTSYDPSKGIAGFQPLQTNAQQGIANMQVPGQYDQATNATQQSMQNLQNAGYQGGDFGNQFQAPSQYQPGQFSMLQAQAPNLQNYQMQGPQNVQTQSFANPYSAQAYMSPYMQNVVGIQQREAQRAADVAKTGRNAQAVGAGAFGGSRQAIMDAEAERNLATQKGDIQAQGLQSAYGQAQGQFNAEQQARLQAQMANQQAGINVGGQNLNALLGVQQLGAGQNLQSQLANQQASMAAQQAAEQSRQYGAGQGLQAASLAAQYGLAGQQLGEQSRQYGAGYGLQANQAALGAANQLAGLGQQQLAAQQGIYNLQNTTGAQQQALEQQKINQAIQDYSNAQQYPLMQLGTMSNMLRGLPMQAQTTQQYVAAPNPVTQAIGAAGAGASLYNAFKGAEGGLPSEFKKSGIMSYAEGGEVDAIDKASKMATIANALPRIGFSAGGISNDIEHDLYSMDEDDLQRQLKESSSPSVKRMAQRILRMKQMENQPQQPGMAGGGIIAFAEPTDKNNQSLVTEPKPAEQTPPTSSEILQQRVMQGKPTGDVMAQPQGIVQTPAPAPKPTLTALQATQADPNIPDVLKSQISDIQARADRSIPDIMKERQAAYEAAGVAQRDPEERTRLMQERANAEDEAKRNRYLQAAAFFARWGSTPGSTLAAGLTAVRERVPEIVESEKEARTIRMQIDKSIASLDEATRLEKKGKIDEAVAIKEKDAAKMQDLYLKLADYEMAAKKEAASEAKMEKQEALRAEREKSHDIRLEGMRKDLQDSINKTTLEAERIRRSVMGENKEMQNKTNQLAKLNAATSLQTNVEAKIANEIISANYQNLMADAALVGDSDVVKSKAAAAKTELGKIHQGHTKMRETAQTTLDFVKQEIGMTPPPEPKPTPGNRPQVKGAAARGAPPRAPIDSFYNK